MSLKDMFKITPPSLPEESTEPDKIIKGKIYHINTDVEKGGYAFISSPDIPFTRIFMHWQALEHDTKHFTELKNGMEVEFKAVKHPELGWRAIKVKVL